jgi:CubicO group peptidase (beta-lactamase class C family)
MIGQKTKPPKEINVTFAMPIEYDMPGSSGGIMKRIPFFFLSVFIVLVAWVNLGAVSPGSNIEKLITAYNKNGQFNGTILVKKGKTVVYEGAFGLADRQWDIKNTLDAKFLIGSVSKSVTALMVLILVNDGLVNLDSTINTYIPQYEGPGKGQATIHQMLTHTSGIPDHGAIPNLSKKRVRWMYDSDQYLELVKETALKFEPGKGFQYSGIAYNLLAIMCEKVTNTNFAELLKRRIFIPLQMNDTSLNTNLEIALKRANGYEYYLLEGYKLPSYISMDHCKGSGGILSTVEDLAKFNFECFDAQTLIAKSLYQKMFTPYVKDWQHYGYGWWITTIDLNGASRTLISHGGSTDGYKAYSTRIVEDHTDIIMLENDYFRTDVGVKWCLDITEEIIDILAGKEVAEPKKSIAKEVGLTIGRAGIKQALAQLSALKKNEEYRITADDYGYLAAELDKKHDLKQEAIEIYNRGLMDFPDDFELNYNLAVIMAGAHDERALELYQNCIKAFDLIPEKSKKYYSEEYKKALAALDAK